MSEQISRAEFDALYSDVKDIKKALVGDDKYDNKGYSQRIAELEQDMQSLYDFKRKLVFYAGCAAGFATAVVQLIATIVN